jgi:hypothetical protein
MLPWKASRCDASNGIEYRRGHYIERRTGSQGYCASVRLLRRHERRLEDVHTAAGARGFDHRLRHRHDAGAVAQRRAVQLLRLTGNQVSEVVTEATLAAASGGRRGVERFCPS